MHAGAHTQVGITTDAFINRRMIAEPQSRGTHEVGDSCYVKSLHLWVNGIVVCCKKILEKSHMLAQLFDLIVCNAQVLLLLLRFGLDDTVACALLQYKVAGLLC